MKPKTNKFYPTYPTGCLVIVINSGWVWSHIFFCVASWSKPMFLSYFWGQGYLSYLYLKIHAKYNCKWLFILCRTEQTRVIRLHTYLDMQVVHRSDFSLHYHYSQYLHLQVLAGYMYDFSFGTLSHIRQNKPATLTM